MDDPKWMSLRDFVAGLRTELRAAHDDAAAGDDTAPRFVVGPVTVEFSLAARKEAGVKGGVRFYVFELGASGSVASEATQRVSMTLTPLDKDGNPFNISDRMRKLPD